MDEFNDEGGGQNSQKAPNFMAERHLVKYN